MVHIGIWDAAALRFLQDHLPRVPYGVWAPIYTIFCIVSSGSRKFNQAVHRALILVLLDDGNEI